MPPTRSVPTNTVYTPVLVKVEVKRTFEMVTKVPSGSNNVNDEDISKLVVSGLSCKTIVCPAVPLNVKASRSAGLLREPRNVWHVLIWVAPHGFLVRCNMSAYAPVWMLPELYL